MLLPGLRYAIVRICQIQDLFNLWLGLYIYIWLAFLAPGANDADKIMLICKHQVVKENYSEKQRQKTVLQLLIALLGPVTERAKLYIASNEPTILPTHHLS